jgi:2-polyprenyl-3-methyl-5-hydroxy-6-metoxy-1,4-benzoquinol methylase
MAPYVVQAHSACPACGSYHAQVLAERDGKSGEALLTVACADCGLGRIDPLPTPDALAQWYARAYREDYKAASQPRLRHVLRAARVALQRWHWLAAHAHLAQDARTLDVGASSGEFVYLLRRLGLQARGIEPHHGYALHASQHLGLDVTCGTLQDQAHRFGTASLQLVTLFHVLEHLVQPLQELKRVRGLLAPDGLLYLEVPNTLRMAAPHTLFFRAHALHFTPRTLQAVVRTAGFEVVACTPDELGNVSLLARPAHAVAQALTPSADAPEVAATWQPNDELVQAQRQRTWGRYAIRQLLSGAPWAKLGRQWEERQSVRGYGSAQPLLDAVYAPLLGPRAGSHPLRPMAVQAAHAPSRPLRQP